MIITLRILTVIGIVILIVLSILVFISDESLHIVNYDIESEKIDKDLDGFKVVQISDVHNHSNKYRNGNIVDLIKNEKPDVIFLTGDIIDQYTRDRHIENIKELLDGIKDYSAFYINGNHEDYAHKKDEFFNSLKEYQNIVVLNDKNYEFSHNGKCINLTGLEDVRMHFSKEVREELQIQYQKPIIEKLNKELKDNRFNILLSHRPQLMDMYAEYNYDLVISGHTHGGQIKISKPHRFQSGIYKVKDSALIVSNGTGSNAKLPIRFNCPMQLVTITLRSKK